MDTIKLGRGDLKALLQEFQESKPTVKVQYSVWRTWQKSYEMRISLDTDSGVYWVTAIQDNGNANHSYFNENDKGGFGSFLKKKYGGETMEINNAVFYNKNTGEPILNLGKATITCDTNTTDYWNGEYSDSTIANLNDTYTITGTILNSHLYNNTPMKEKEERKMDTNKIFNFEFGFITGNDSIRMSPYGMAVKNQAGNYVAYDKASGDIFNVEVLNFKMDKMFLKMPVAVNAVAVGDVLIHNRVPCFVTGFVEDTGNPMVVDIYAGERKEIMLQRSPFGFSYVTKVVSLFDGMNMGADASNPFGNIWMFALMGENGKMEDMLLPMMMMGGQMDMNNPLMLMMLAGKGNDNLLPLMLMMQNQKK